MLLYKMHQELFIYFFFYLKKWQADIFRHLNNAFLLIS